MVESGFPGYLSIGILSKRVQVKGVVIDIWSKKFAICFTILTFLHWYQPDLQIPSPVFQNKVCSLIVVQVESGI